MNKYKIKTLNMRYYKKIKIFSIISSQFIQKTMRRIHKNLYLNKIYQ